MDEQIVFMEFQNGKPFSVITHNRKGYPEFYDIEWCKRNECLYYHCSGSGGNKFEVLISPPANFWIADHLQAIDCSTKNPVKKTMEIPKKYQGPMEGWADECETIYCTVCDDWLPYDYNDPCQHLFWSESWAMWAGCGSDEPQEEHKELVFAFLEKTGLALELKTALKLHSYSIYEDSIELCDWYFDERIEDIIDYGEEEIVDGIGWLSSLEPGVTLDAEQLTIQWIDEYLLKKREIVFRKSNRR